MKDLVIIGASGFGREVAHYIREINENKPTWNFLGFIDDEIKETPEGDIVLGNLDWLLSDGRKPYFAVAVLNCEEKAKVAERCVAAGLPVATIIHHTSTIEREGTIGEGSIICPKCRLRANFKVGNFCTINAMCTLGYDTMIDDYSTVMPLSIIEEGNYIGKYNYLGLKSTMIEGVKTTDHCTFKACSAIGKDAVEPGVYEGIPAKLVSGTQG